MTMPTHAGGPFTLVRYSLDGRDARKAMIKRFCMRALTALIVGAVVAGIVALKTTIGLSRLNY